MSHRESARWHPAGVPGSRHGHSRADEADHPPTTLQDRHTSTQTDPVHTPTLNPAAAAVCGRPQCLTGDVTLRETVKGEDTVAKGPDEGKKDPDEGKHAKDDPSRADG